MKHCHFCKQNILGKFWQYSNKQIYCDPCYRKHPKCSGCSIPIQTGLKQQQKIYCKGCTAKTKRCHYCHIHIFDKYWKIEKNVICDPCYQKYPKCSRCQIPSREYLTIQELKICLSCVQLIAYCAKCRIPLMEKFFSFPHDTRKFCAVCVKSKDCCDTCNTPITGKYFQIGDKRNICHKCMNTAIKSPAEAKKILSKVILFLQQQFQMKVNLSTKLELVDALTLSKIRTKNAINYGSMDRRALGLFVQQGSNYHVYIEALLPYTLCMGVLAHEYTHALQADNFHRKANLLILEGLAEWISYKTLLYYGHQKEAESITLKRDIYGQGFQKIQNLEKKYGDKNVLERVKSIVNNGFF